MKNKSYGGPAFAHGNPEQGGDPGMSLRDWFAGQALAGVMGRMHENIQSIGSHTFPANISAHAYRIADAMLAAREGGGK